MVENHDDVNINEVVRTVAQELIERREHEYRFKFCIHDIIKEVEDQTGIRLEYLTVKAILDDANIDIAEKKKARPTFFHKKEETKEETK